MKTLSSYEESFSAPDAAIIKEARALKDGDELSREGACGFFYDTIEYEGSSFLFTEGKDHLIFYADHDDVLQNIENDNCKFHIQNSDTQTIMMLINGEGVSQLNIPLTFKYEEARDRQVLRLMKKTGTLEICFLAIALGNIYREKIISFKLPDNIIADLPE